MPFGSVNARMTFPRASKPVLMCMDSLRRSPVLPVLSARSDPAKSIRRSLEVRLYRVEVWGSWMRWCRWSVRMACERLDWSFMAVGPVRRRAFPVAKTLRSSSAEHTSCSTAPTSTVDRNREVIMHLTTLDLKC
uniref:Uncharacterized protein n=1 Tax=Periophthalmus magnuspinnatus TaxID=409849 RepID=A0A3B4APG9_9GOBI